MMALMNKTQIMIKQQTIKWLALLLVCFFYTTITQAQAPGYLGKRLSIGIGTSIYPALYGPTKNKKGYNLRRGGSFVNRNREPSFGLNSSFEVSLDYATGRYRTLGIYGNTYTTGVSMNYFNINTNQEIRDFYLLDVNTIGLQYSFFKSEQAALAPIGRNFTLGLEGLFLKGRPEMTSDIEFSRRIYNVAFKYMMSYPINNSIILKLGGSIRLPLLSLSEYVLLIDDNPYIHRSTESAFIDRSLRRVLYHGLMRFEFGIHYLIK